MDDHREIENQAAALLAKRDSGNWSVSDEASLEQWIHASVAHRVAFLRLEAVWEEARRLKALGAGLQPGVIPAPGDWRHTPFFEGSSEDQQEGSRRRAGSRATRHPWLSLAAAAIVLLALGIGAYIALAPYHDRYATPVGAVASVALQDGSSVTLNTSSEVHVELTHSERQVNLDRGEAFFEVAKDPTRPFVVHAGDKRIVAVGTKFSVRRSGDAVYVAVAEGKVRVTTRLAESDAAGVTGSVTREPAEISGGRVGEVLVPAGSVASADDSGVLVRQESVAEVEDGLSWRHGYLTFHETTLADAVAEFNRYNDQRITIDDPEIARIRISGTFRATNYQGFLRLLDDGYSIHSSKVGENQTNLTR